MSLIFTLYSNTLSFNKLTYVIMKFTFNSILKEVVLMEPEIMTISQVAKYLQISEMTTYKLVQEGKLPGFKIGRHWRVRRNDLDEHIERLKNGERL